MANKKISFEEAVDKLQQACDSLKSDDLPLEKSVEVYEEALKYYNAAEKILKDTKQKIQIYKPENSDLEDFEIDE